MFNVLLLLKIIKLYVMCICLFNKNKIVLNYYTPSMFISPVLYYKS